MVDREDNKGIEEVIELMEVMEKQKKIIEQQSKLIDQLIKQQALIGESIMDKEEVYRIVKGYPK